MVDIKPCPFCGSAAECNGRRHYVDPLNGRTEVAIAVRCTSCPADIYVSTADVPGITLEQVVAMWNTRSDTGHCSKTDQTKTP